MRFPNLPRYILAIAPGLLALSILSAAPDLPISADVLLGLESASSCSEVSRPEVLVEDGKSKCIKVWRGAPCFGKADGKAAMLKIAAACGWAGELSAVASERSY